MIEYTDLYVCDGQANRTTGAVVQYWMAANSITGKRTSVTTYDGEERSTSTYDLKQGWDDKKYTKVTGTSVPSCFKMIGAVEEPVLSPAPTSVPITQPEPTAPINLSHSIITSLNFDDIDKLTNPSKFSKFVGVIDSIAGGKHPYDKDAYAKCKGDIFEVFVEFLIKYQGRDPNIGITDYAIQQTKDFGVDGVGKSTRNAKPVTVQAKYRQFSHVIKWNDDHIANFYNQSRGDYFDKIGFIPMDGANMLLVTSAHEVHYSVSDFSYNKMRWICHDGLVQLTDHMVTFWEEFARALKSKKPTGTPTDLIRGKELREHQRDAVEKVMSTVGTDEPRLVIEFPTGTGKTLIQAEIIRRCWSEKGCGCALIISPAILLTYQHLTEIADHLTANGIDAEYLNISSGEFDDAQIRKLKEERGMEANYIDSTTDVRVINEKYAAAKIKNKLLVISSTYQSAEKVWKAGKTANEQWRPDIQMNDEAHFVSNDSGYYLGNPDDPEGYCTLRVATGSYSFTATPTFGKAGVPHLMRWEDGKDSKGNRIYLTNPLWGEVFRMSPKELIERGEMLRPVAHLVDTVDTNGNSQRLEKAQPVQGSDGVEDKAYYDELWRCIEQSYNYHREYMLGNSADRTQLAPKLLVTLDFQETIIRILGGELLKKSDENGKTVPLRLISGDVVHENDKSRRTGTPSFEEFLKSKPADMHVFAIASGTGAYIDGEWQGSAVDKGQFLRKLKEVPDTEGAIILYVDMLTEGIDVPGITGFMPMRNIGYSKFKQGMGRASRLFKGDRVKFYAHQIQDTLQDAKNYVKPHSAVIIPMALVAVIEAADEYLRIWREVLEEYGAFYEFIISSNRAGGTVKKSALDSVQELSKLLRESQPGVRKIIQGVFDDPQKLLLDIDAITAVEFMDRVGENAARLVFKEAGFDPNLGRPSNSFTDSTSTLKLRAVVNQSYDMDFARMIKSARNSGQGVFADKIKSKFGTIYTPENIVTMTVDLAFKHLDKSLDRTTLKYCDPAAGDGNFFTVLYKRLMADEQFVARFPDPIARSRHIVTECIWGFEILKNMWMACRIRLVMLHAETVKGANSEKLTEELTGLVDKLHIYWGNTIKSPEDTDFSPDAKIGEGDTLPEELRAMKFDVIVGNPPYTRLEKSSRSSGYSTQAGRRYYDYNNQRDMAQIFVLWGFRHNNHVVSFNISDSILGKVVDGAKETRTEIYGHLSEINRSNAVLRYSEGDGGDQNTCILCLARVNDKTGYCRTVGQIDKYDVVECDKDAFIDGDFKKLCANLDTTYPFSSRSVIDYLKPLQERRTINSSDAAAKPRKTEWQQFIFKKFTDGPYYVVSNMRHYLRSDYKLIQTAQLPETIDNNFVGRIKFGEVAKEMGIWLIGYWATKLSSTYLSTYTDARQEGNYEFKTFLWKFMQVPDFDWYKTNRPTKHADFLTWVEANMTNKEVFLAGIDEQFEKLIGE